MNDPSCSSPIVRVDLGCELTTASGEPSRYLREWLGNIFLHHADDTETKIGTLHLILIPTQEIRVSGYSLFDVMDSLSSETMDCFEALFDVETEDWNSMIYKRYGDHLDRTESVILIDRLEINRSYRSRGYGQQAVQTVVDHLSCLCDLFVCKPFPLDYERRGRPSRSIADMGNFSNELRRVKRFWQRIGFRALGSTKHMVRPARLGQL